jgi:hypothetical protein
MTIHLQNKTKNLLSIGSQEANNSINCNTTICIKKLVVWFFTKQFRLLFNLRIFRKNYEINGFIGKKISYLFSKNTSWDIFYELQKKPN